MKLSALFRGSMLAACFGLFTVQSLAAESDLPALLTKKPTLFDFKISPDGNYLAAKTYSNNKAVLVFLDAKTLTMLSSVPMGGDLQVG